MRIKVNTRLIYAIIFLLNIRLLSAQTNFPFASEYRFLKGSQAASLSSGWMLPAFNDASWQTGYAPFWYGDGSGGTQLTDMLNNYLTVYLRSEFEVENAAGIQQLNFLIDYDDGFVIWVNGIEALAVNAPAGYGYNQNAPENHESGTPVTFPVQTNDLNLVDGFNTLAVQVFNVSLTSTDFHFRCQITAETPVYPDTIGVGFSHPSGYYDDPFTLSLSSPDPLATLVYTIDGSNPQTSATSISAGATTTISIDPSISSGRGTTPGFVIRASIVRDGFQPSYPTGRTFLFNNQLRTQSYPGHDWPSGDVEGVTGNGYQIIDYDMDPDVVNDSRYTDLIDDAFFAIPAISIITDNANLFDPNIGIYVNAYGEGTEWERECTVELINPGGSEGFNVNAGLRIRGGWSRHSDFPKHAFRLFFRSQYGNAKLMYPLFGSEGVNSFDKIDLRCEQNYAWSIGLSENSMVREVFSRDSQRDTHQPYTRSRYYHLFLNGMYWGLYQSQERAEARYASDYFGDNHEDYDVIKVNSANYNIEATDGNDQLWRRLYNLCEKGFENDSDYFALEGRNKYGLAAPGGRILVDIDNLIDYMIGIFYTGNFDAPTSSFSSNTGCNNFYAIVDRDDKDKGFVFFNHDAEHSLFYDPKSPGIGIYENRVNIGTRTDGMRMVVNSFDKFHPQWLHFKLTSNEEYRIRFADRAVKHLTNNGVYTRDRCTERLNARVQQIQTAVIAESARWGDGKRDWASPYTKDDTWVPEINRITKSFIPVRTNIVINQLRDEGLFPELDAPELKRNSSLLEDDVYQVSGTWQVSMSNPNDLGTIYYTLDNTDPRKLGGGISASAIEGENGHIIDISYSTIIKARIYDEGVWSGLRHINFFSDEDDLSNLKITELHYHPQDIIEGIDTTFGADLEFMEFKNTGPTSLNLSGVFIDYGVTYEFPANTILGPGQFYVVASKPSIFYNQQGKVASGNFQGNLANSGEEIAVRKGITDIIRFSYDDTLSWPKRPDGDGPSLVSVSFNPTGDPGNPAYWRASYHPGGSPFADDIMFPTATEPVTAGSIPFKVITYPNPSGTYLNIEIYDQGAIERQYNLRIFSMNGLLVYETFVNDKMQLELDELNMKAGIYILSVQSENHLYNGKIVYKP